MKNYLVIIIALCCPVLIFSQHLEVEGDAKIKGKVEVIIADGDSSIYIGANAGAVNFAPDLKNTFVGNNTGNSFSLGFWNTFIGYNAGMINGSNGNTFIGRGAGKFNNSYSNLFIGNNTGRDNTGFENTMVGTQAGLNSSGSGHVFLGAFAGFNATGHNKLFIENSNSDTPLIYGEFDNDLVRINGKLEVGEVDTMNTQVSSIVRKSDGTLAVRQYKIGDFAQGGVVFWVDETGEHGLVCDTADISSEITWWNSAYKVTNATGDGVGAGQMNTMLIISQQTIDNPGGNFAALICANLVIGPYGDWYLPSKEELNLMFINKSAIDAVAIANGGSGFASAPYWSSAEIGTDGASAQNFGDGTTSTSNKASDFNLHVRAVRAF